MENTLSENTLSENTLSENTLSENTLSENTLSENTLLENTLLENTLLENTLSENTLSEYTLSENTQKYLGSSLFNFSRRVTRDADRLEIRKYHLPTDRHTWVGARDTCVSKNQNFSERTYLNHC